MDREGWNARYAGQPLLWNVDPGPFLGQELNGVAPGTVLDLGAGEGRNTLWLAERGWRVTAVDFAEVALERGRARAAELGLAPDTVTGCAPIWSTTSRRRQSSTSSSPCSSTCRRRTKAACCGGRPRRWPRAAPSSSSATTRPTPPRARKVSGTPRSCYPEDVVVNLPGLEVQRADRRRVGKAIDAIVRARRPLSSGRPQSA